MVPPQTPLRKLESNLWLMWVMWVDVGCSQSRTGSRSGEPKHQLLRLGFPHSSGGESCEALPDAFSAWFFEVVRWHAERIKTANGYTLLWKTAIMARAAGCGIFQNKRIFFMDYLSSWAHNLQSSACGVLNYALNHDHLGPVGAPGEVIPCDRCTENKMNTRTVLLTF